MFLVKKKRRSLVRRGKGGGPLTLLRGPGRFWLWLRELRRSAISGKSIVNRQIIRRGGGRTLRGESIQGDAASLLMVKKSSPPRQEEKKVRVSSYQPSREYRTGRKSSRERVYSRESVSPSKTWENGGGRAEQEKEEDHPLRGEKGSKKKNLLF